jgi:hypothetical protein
VDYRTSVSMGQYLSCGQSARDLGVSTRTLDKLVAAAKEVAA